MSELDFHEGTQSIISELIRIGSSTAHGSPARPFIGDCGEETEQEARERCVEEFDSQISKMQEFLEDRYDLTLAIARAACAFDASPTELNRQEMVRAVDQAREAYIQKRTRL